MLTTNNRDDLSRIIGTNNIIAESGTLSGTCSEGDNKTVVELNPCYFELTDETIMVKCRMLHRIRCTKTFESGKTEIKEGSLGGFVEKLENVVSDGSWVFDNAIVMDSAIICQGSKVCDVAIVCDQASVCNSVIKAQSVVAGRAQVNNSYVDGLSAVYENATVQNVRLEGKTCICGHATVKRSSPYDKARLFVRGEITIEGNATVVTSGMKPLTGHYLISDAAYITSPSDVCSFNGFGSEYRTLTAYRTKYNGVRIVTGCFYGDLAEFCKELDKKDPDSIIYQEYRLVARIIKHRFLDNNPDDYSKTERPVCND